MATVDPKALTDQMAARGYAFHKLDGEDPVQFQVLGERASGTNVVRKTIERNCRMVRSEGLGWKHGFPVMVAVPQDLLVVMAFRNAIGWALSMHRRPWHAHPEMQALTFSDFLRAEWNSVVDRPGDFEMIHPELAVQGQPLQFDRHPITGKPFENLIALRRAKMDAVLGMMNRDCSFALVQLEAIQSHGAQFMTDYREYFGAVARRDYHRAVTRKMGNRFRPSVRERPATPGEVSAEDRSFILSQLDLESERLLGYSY